eukprot:TRINITY_DN5427_c0_g1_i1.p1 TRINITY_DN5427_c0_g1~~TRINITY_DN5427_c0_g1_i1.p1  ORF type:complete len:503 (+),score=123.26 TRINITY_DN5427_c0_g1_i1:40-1548(+)
MSSAREEAQVQEILKELRKLNDNKTCMICTEKFPQYVCTNFGTFVCSSCSGIHREFGHRIKGISLSTFTMDEARNLQKAGNGVAIATYLARWNPSDYPKPDPSNKEEVRRFIRMAFVEQAWKAKGGSEPQREPEPSKKSKEYMVKIPRAQTQPVAPAAPSKPKASIDDLLISWDDSAGAPSQAQNQPQQSQAELWAAPTPQQHQQAAAPPSAAASSPFAAFYDPQVSPSAPSRTAVNGNNMSSPASPVAAAPLVLPSTIHIPQPASMPQPQPQQQPQQQQQFFQPQPQQQMPIQSQFVPQFVPYPQPAPMAAPGGPQPVAMFNPFTGQIQSQQPQVQQIAMQMSPQPQPQYRPVVQGQPGAAPAPQMMFNPFGGQPQAMVAGPGGAPMMVMQMPPPGAMMMAPPPQMQPGRPGMPQQVFIPAGAQMPGGQPQMMMMRPMGAPGMAGAPQSADSDYLLALRLQEEENRAAGGGVARAPAASMSEDEKLARRLQEEENARGAWD